MRVNGNIDLPANAHARLEQSSLLGEKYIQLTPPARGTARGSLAESGRIPLTRTNRNPEVEEVFGALSMLLNGGGINQLKTITTELNKALTGQEPQIRSVLNRVDTLVTNLDDNRGDITRALDGVNRLSATLATRKQDVGTVLTGLSPGLKVLEKQRGSLLTMLRSLDALSTVAVDTVNRSKADMIADLKALAPTLKALADSGQDLPDSLQASLTYPFTDEVLRGVKGDYLNVYLDVTAAPGTRIIPALTPDDPTLPRPARTGRRRRGRYGGRGGSSPERAAAPAAGRAGHLAARSLPDTGDRAGEHPVITPAIRLKNIAFLVIAVLVLGYLGVRYAGLGHYVGLRSYYTVTVQLPQTGGLYTHSNVTYRGVSVGRVGPIELTDDGVEAELRIEKDAPPIPDSLRAVVANLSAVGEQYVDLRPTRSDGPYLGHGSVIDAADTTLPARPPKYSPASTTSRARWTWSICARSSRSSAPPSKGAATTSRCCWTAGASSSTRPTRRCRSPPG